MGNRAPVNRTIQNCYIHFHGVCPNNSARLPIHGAAAHLQQCVQLLDVLTHVGVVFDEVLVGFEVHYVHRIEPAAAAAPPFRGVPPRSDTAPQCKAMHHRGPVMHCNELEKARQSNMKPNSWSMSLSVHWSRGGGGESSAQ